MRWDTIPGIRITGAGGYGVALKNMFGGGLKFKATFSENGTLSNNIFPALSNLTAYIFKNLGTFSKVFGFTYMYIDLIIKKRKQLIQLPLTFIICISRDIARVARILFLDLGRQLRRAMRSVFE